MKKHAMTILLVSLSCIFLACGLKYPLLQPIPKIVKLEMSCLQGGADTPGAKAFFSDSRVDSVSVEVISSTGTTLGTAILVKGASSWTGSMNVTVSGSETLSFKARAYANALGTIHYYGESTMLINESDVSVSITIPTALWHSVWTAYPRIYKDYSAIASSSDGTMLVVGITSSGNPGTISTSTDSGVTWVVRTSSGQHLWAGLASSSDGMKLAAATFTNFGGDYIHTSTDAGLTWTAQTAAGQREWKAIACSADGTKLAAVPRSGYIWTSADSGLTWNQTNTPNADWNSIASSADGMKLAAVNSGIKRVYLSTDYGVTWTYSSGFSDARIIKCSADGTKLFVAGARYIYRSLDSGATWTTLVSNSSNFWDAIASSSDGTKIVAYDGISGYTYISTDSGITWTTSTGFRKEYMYSIASSADGTKLIACGYLGYLYTSIQ